MRRVAMIGLGAAWLLLSGCDREEGVQGGGAAPPPIESSKPGVCSAGGGEVSDAISAKFFPKLAGGYCVDPNGETRSYGAQAKDGIDAACTQLFDGECEVYKSFGLDRVVTLRYVDGEGSAGQVNVNLSRFDSKEGAYGFYTKRVLADSDPAQSTTKQLDAPAASAQGSTIAYVWRDRYVAELSYVNELQAPDQLRATSAEVLPAIAKELGRRLPGDAALLPQAQALPEAGRIPLGIEFAARDVLDVAGAGPGAVGYYRDGDKRYRIFVIQREAADAAEDVFDTFAKLDGAKRMKGHGFDALRVQVQDAAMGDGAPKRQWLIGRRGVTVFGVGDEPLVMGGTEPEKQLLDETEKLGRLRSLIHGVAAASEKGSPEKDSGSAESKTGEPQPSAAPAE